MDQLYFLFQGWLGNVFRGTGKGRISWWWGFLNLRGLPREVCCWLWKQPSSPSTQEESFLEHPCSPRACPEGTPWHGGGGGGRRCSIWVEIIPRRHFKAFPSFLKVHSIPTLRITMKCWTFSRPFLSWVSVALLDKILARWWESAPFLTLCERVSCKDIGLFYVKSFCETNKNPISPAHFYLLKEPPLPFPYIERKPLSPSVNRISFPPKSCYANGGDASMHRKSEGPCYLFLGSLEASSFSVSLTRPPSACPSASVLWFGTAAAPDRALCCWAGLQTVPVHAMPTSTPGFCPSWLLTWRGRHPDKFNSFTHVLPQSHFLPGSVRRIFLLSFIPQIFEWWLQSTKCKAQGKVPQDSSLLASSTEERLTDRQGQYELHLFTLRAWYLPRTNMECWWALACVLD